MPTVVELLRQRETLTAEARGLVDAAESRGEAPGEREAARLEELRGLVEALDGRVRSQALVDEMDRTTPGRTLSGDDRFDRELRSFRLTRLMASSFDDTIDAGRERELCAETARRSGRSAEGFMVPFGALVPERRAEQRVVTVGGSAAAAGLVGTEHLEAEFIDALRPMTVVGPLGARTLTGLRGDVAIPKRTARTPAPAWFAENASIATGDQAFGSVTGSPKHLGVITEFSRRTLLQSSPQIEQLTREHLLAELGVGIDAAALKGTGIAPIPKGITAHSNIGTSAETAVSWQLVLRARATIEAANVGGPLQWLLNPFVGALMRGTQKGTGGGLWDEWILDENGQVAGLPVATTTLLAGEPGDPGVAGELILGAWSELLIGLWGGLEILVNPYESTAYGKGNVSVRAIADADVMVRHEQAFFHWSAIALGE